MSPPREDFASRVFEAARRSNNNENIIDLAKEYKVSRGSISQARLILEFGSSAQISDAIAGYHGIKSIADKVRATLPEETLKALRSRNGSITDGRRDEIATEALLWNRFGPSIRNLAELPKPIDMIPVVKSNNQRELAVLQYLETATKWLKEFTHEWELYRRIKSAENPTDAGDGDSDVGT